MQPPIDEHVACPSELAAAARHVGIVRCLGWTVPKVRDPHTADLWTWLIIAAHTQLRLARPLAEDLRRPPGNGRRSLVGSPLPGSDGGSATSA